MTDLPAAAAAQRRAWAVRAALPGAAASAAPVEEIERASFAARARAWHDAGWPRVVVRRVDPWAPSTPWSAPGAEVTDTLALWPGAWGAAAVDVACAAGGAAQIVLALAPGAPGAPAVTLRRVVPVEARDGRWAGDALPLAPDALAVPDGAAVQLWLDVDARDARPGAYTAELTIGSAPVRVPMRVHAVRVASPPIGALDWTYPTSFALLRAAPADAVRDNAEHGIDTWWISEQSVPWPDAPTIDAAGHLTRPPDFTACDRELALHGAARARRIGFFWNFDAQSADPSRGHFRHPYLSPAWRQAVREWLGAWMDHLAGLGIDRTRVVMQPFDETTAAPVATLLRALHALRPDLPLALTITRNATADEVRALGPELAMPIFERRTLATHAAWIRAATSRGVAVWTYDVLEPSKAVTPVAGYRALAWEAWARGLAGAAFWSYGDTGEKSADAWDDFDGARCDFAVVYGRDGAPVPVNESFVPSKRWQAFRMGLQDAALFATLADAGWHDTVLRDVQSGAATRDPESLRRRALRALARGAHP
jgi:hypothetical protein